MYIHYLQCFFYVEPFEMIMLLHSDLYVLLFLRSVWVVLLVLCFMLICYLVSLTCFLIVSNILIFFLIYSFIIFILSSNSLFSVLTFTRAYLWNYIYPYSYPCLSFPTLKFMDQFLIVFNFLLDPLLVLIFYLLSFLKEEIALLSGLWAIELSLLIRSCSQAFFALFLALFQVLSMHFFRILVLYYWILWLSYSICCFLSLIQLCSCSMVVCIFLLASSSAGILSLTKSSVMISCSNLINSNSQISSIIVLYSINLRNIAGLLFRSFYLFILYNSIMWLSLFLLLLLQFLLFELELDESEGGQMSTRMLFIFMVWVILKQRYCYFQQFYNQHNSFESIIFQINYLFNLLLVSPKQRN